VYRILDVVSTKERRPSNSRVTRNQTCQVSKNLTGLAQRALEFKAVTHTRSADAPGNCDQIGTQF
jgi:hypothetical protein